MSFSLSVTLLDELAQETMGLDILWRVDGGLSINGTFITIFYLSSDHVTPLPTPMQGHEYLVIKPYRQHVGV